MSATPTICRPFRAEDIDAVFAIYDDEALHGNATFDTEASSADARRRWRDLHLAPAYPAIVAEVGDTVVGWASVSPYSERAAYARAAESSVYVHKGHRGIGIGRDLLIRIVDRARSAGLRVLVARITSESTASVELHRSVGFEPVGTLRRIGEKFGRVLDVELLDLHLD